MSQLLISWLNDEVQLSKRITNFQQDFNNGYLLGELLEKYSQQLNFNQFINKNDKDSKIKNFTNLFQTFKTLGVSMDANIAFGIIQKKVGVAKKMLYELKMQLQKTAQNSFSKMAKPNKPLSPLKKIPLPKEQFDKIAKEHFNKQLNELHRAQKNLDLDAHLQKFPQFHQKQLKKVDLEEKKQLQVKNLLIKNRRQKLLQNTKKSADFRNDWEETNRQKWAVNMSVRRIQQQKDVMFKTKIETSKIQTKTMSELSAIKSLDKDLRDFQKKVPKRLNDSDSSAEEQQLPTSKTGLIKKPSTRIGNNNLYSVNQFQSSIPNSTFNNAEEPRRKKNPQEAQQTRHQKQKRRRKMIVEQSKRHQLIKIDRLQKYIINTLEQTSKQQKQIEYEIWRAWHSKDVIVQNHKNQLQKIKQKSQVKQLNTKFKNQELTKTYREEHQKQLSAGIQRQKELKTQNSVKQRKECYSSCKNIIQDFISMVEVLFQNGQQKNQQNLNDVFLNHLFDEFVESAQTKQQIAELQLSKYIHGQGDWKLQIKRGNEQQITDPILQNSIPNTIVNNYYLGNILKTVFGELYTKNQVNQNADVVKFDNLVSILGLQFAGKQLVANKIKQQFGFNIVKIQDLVAQRLQDYRTFTEKGLQIDGQTAELVELCYSGKPIPNTLILNLVKNTVTKNPKTLLLNYPITYSECIQFTKVFGNTSPTDYVPKQKLQTKIQQFSRLVWPTQKKVIAKKLQPCGLDFCLWIDIDVGTSLDRFLGRRWNSKGQCLHIRDQIENPNDLQTGPKAASLIEKNNFKIHSKQHVQNWLSQFGLQVGQENVQKCWQVISGQCSIEELYQRAANVFEQNLTAKQIKKQQILKQEQDLEEIAKNQQSQKKLQQELKLKCVLSAPEKIKQSLKAALDFVKIDERFLQKLSNLWNNTQKLSINAFVTVFQTLRNQQQSKSRYIANTKRNFLRLLTREDERFLLVKRFQNQYNKFMSLNNDMVVQDYTKQQLHQRIQDLQMDLLTIIEQKKEDAIIERESIMKSGWLQNQLELIMSSVQILLQTELNRSFVCQQIISDFYSKKYLVAIGEIQDPQNELKMQGQLEIVKQNSFPRLEKVVSEALRLFNKEEEIVQDKNKKGGKAPPKKDDKKQAKKGGKQEVEQKAQPTFEELQYKKAINTQKAIFRYRVKIIEVFAQKKIKEFQKDGLRLYSDLQQFYRYNDRVENKSILQMTKIFKRAIEQEAKIQNEVAINYTDIIQSQKIRNFQKPNPIIQPAVEQTKNQRFTVSAIIKIMQLFKNESETGFIKNHRLMSLFHQLLTNKRYRVLLPEAWTHLGKTNYEHFISVFDPYKKGQVQLWTVFLTIVLSNYNIPSTQQIKQYRLSVTGHNPLTAEITLQQIVKTPSWFDSEEPQQQNIRVFDRNKHIKTILFDSFKNSNESVTVTLDKFLSRLGLTEFLKNGQSSKLNNETSYFQFAFGKI